MGVRPGLCAARLTEATITAAPPQTAEVSGDFPSWIGGNDSSAAKSLLAHRRPERNNGNELWFRLIVISWSSGRSAAGEQQKTVVNRRIIGSAIELERGVLIHCLVHVTPAAAIIDAGL